MPGFAAVVMRRMAQITLLFAFGLSQVVHAGAQKEEALSDSIRVLLRQSVAGQIQQYRPFTSNADERAFLYWRANMAQRMARFVAEPESRNLVLNAVDYEARRAGLEPALVLGVIQVESHFQPSAKSPVGARGLMQVMPFWSRTIGDGRIDGLNGVRTNIRYGCVILRYYLDKENGDLVRALARYNGSLGKTHYAEQVLQAAAQWR